MEHRDVHDPAAVQHLRKKLNEGEESNLTLYQTLFDLQLTICERFNMSPFQLRREPFHEVCILLGRVNDHADRNPKGKQGDTVIRRKAKDNWF